MSTTTPLAMARSRVTPEELLEMPDGDRFELVDGELKERSMGARSVWVACRLAKIISNWVDSQGAGWVFGSTLQYRIFPHDPGRIRMPDVSFVKAQRFEPRDLDQGFCTIVPDLVVEVISPGDRYLDLSERIDDYARAGVPLMWVVDPELKQFVVHDLPAGTARRLSAGGELDGGSVLPGFRLPVSAVFEYPASSLEAPR